jgi:dipeptidase D
MMETLETLEPKNLWKYFATLCALPHPSGHLDAVRDYVTTLAEGRGCGVRRDEAGNVLVTVPPTAGCESWPSLALEGHLDMVPQADASTVHDFELDPIRPYVRDGEVRAEGTTLGADNGIGVASMLALMTDDTLRHGPLELLFTADEETGMTGANALSPDWLQSDVLINTDAETEGTIMTGCAGAVDMEATFKYRMDTAVPEGDVAIEVSLAGLQGGHSGMDIHLGRANACKLLFRFLKHAVVNFEARLASVEAGGVRNAIPREARAVITVPAEVVEDMIAEVAYYEELYQYEWRGIEPTLTFRAQTTQLPAALLPEEIQDDVINSIVGCHDGVLRRVPDMPDVVETSSNLASVRTSDEETRILFLIRSANEEQKRALASQLQSVFTLGGARVAFHAAYPGWELPQSAPLLAWAQRVYEQRLGTTPRLHQVHCGLECGIIGAAYPRLQMMSIGPTIHSPHSPAEAVEVESVARYWAFLTALVEAAAELTHHGASATPQNQPLL